MDSNDIEAALRRFTRTENYHRHSAFSYTDGVKFLAEEAGAYWLLDHIASRQKRARKDKSLRAYQVWHLTVGGSRGVLACQRRDGMEIFREEIAFTAFPLQEVSLHLEDGVLRLPWEE